MKITIEVPDNLIVREGVLVVKGWREDGKPFWKAYPVDETDHYAMSDLCRRAHIRLEKLIEGYSSV